MGFSLRVVNRKFGNDEQSFDVMEVHYDDEGKPVRYAPDKNVLGADSFSDLKDLETKVQKALSEPVLVVKEDGTLKESIECPNCGDSVNYDKMDIMGDGSKEEDFGKTVIYCEGICGYSAIRQDHSKQNTEVL